MIAAQTGQWRPDLQSIPHEPGCYLYKTGPEKDAGILYIGKAKDLRKRVTQYFQRDIDAKTQTMLSQAKHIEWIVTRTEVEALLLEARLIRQRKPPYNIELRDNKRYAYLKITEEEYPRLVTIRDPRPGEKKDLYGPFPDGTARAELQQQARRLFRLRVCNVMPKRVCLYYHLGLCSGPCEGKIGKDDYLKDVERARLLLRGKSEDLVEELERGMHAASEDLRFEEARRLRDALRAVNHSATRTVTALERGYDEDVVVSRRLPDEQFFLVLHVRKGMVAGTDEFRVPLSRVDAEAPLDDFLKNYYADHAVPDEVILEEELRDAAIAEYLGALRKRPCAVTIPRAGTKRALLELGQKNIIARIDSAQQVLVELQEALRLPRLPRRIDAFDNSHLQGTDVVSACVRYADAKPDKARYRRFIIRDAAPGDDFAAMAEAVRRRYAKDPSDLPDLIIIDGGKGQLSAAYDALRGLGLFVPVIGLAKREEEVYVPGLPNPLPLDRKSGPMLFVQRVRDEIHRFVIAFHRLRRGRRQVRSALDDIVGIGEKTKFSLLKRFGSLDGVRNASDEELSEILNRRQLGALREYIARNA